MPSMTGSTASKCSISFPELGIHAFKPFAFVTQSCMRGIFSAPPQPVQGCTLPGSPGPRGSSGRGCHGSWNDSGTHRYWHCDGDGSRLTACPTIDYSQARSNLRYYVPRCPHQFRKPRCTIIVIAIAVYRVVYAVQQINRSRMRLNNGWLLPLRACQARQLRIGLTKSHTNGPTPTTSSSTASSGCAC